MIESVLVLGACLVTPLRQPGSVADVCGRCVRVCACGAGAYYVDLIKRLERKAGFPRKSLRARPDPAKSRLSLHGAHSCTPSVDHTCHAVGATRSL